MRVLTLLIVLLVSACSGTQSTPFPKKDVTSFTTRGGSYGVSRDSQYYVFIENENLPAELKLRLANYASYVLEYRGMHETSIAHVADYYVMVSYQEYDSNTKEQYFQLAAASRKVFDATKQFKPRWWATSIYHGARPNHNRMLAMHALSIRDFAGGMPNPYQVGIGYGVNDDVVTDLVQKVER